MKIRLSQPTVLTAGATFQIEGSEYRGTFQVETLTHENCATCRKAVFSAVGYMLRAYTPTLVCTGSHTELDRTQHEAVVTLEPAAA